MGFDIDLNLKRFRGTSIPKKKLRSVLATEQAKLGLNWVNYAMTSKHDNLTFHANV